jgi:hypothetical protein
MSAKNAWQMTFVTAMIFSMIFTLASLAGFLYLMISKYTL